MGPHLTTTYSLTSPPIISSDLRPVVAAQSCVCLCASASVDSKKNSVCECMCVCV